MSRSKVTQQRGWVRGLFGSRSGAGKRAKAGHLAAPAPPATPPPAEHGDGGADRHVNDTTRKHSKSGDATAQSLLESGLKMASPRSSSLHRRRSQKGRRSPLGVRTNAMKAQRDRWSGGTCLDLSQSTAGLAGYADSIESPAWGFAPAFANLSIKSCSLPQSELRVAAAEKDAAWGFDAEPTAWSLDRAENFGGFFA